MHQIAISTIMKKKTKNSENVSSNSCLASHQYMTQDHFLCGPYSTSLHGGGRCLDQCKLKHPAAA